MFCPGDASLVSLDIRRAQGMPDAGRTHGRLQQKTQAAVTTGTLGIPAFPARWFTAYT
jgi:hypothetical protein